MNGIKYCLFIVAVLGCQLSFVSGASAQASYQQQYATAKGFFREGKYNLAMEAFKPLIPYDQANPFQEYASFYFALSAYKQGYKSVAKDMLAQIKSLHSIWDQIDEVNLWLAKIHFENRNHFQGLRVLESIKNNKLKKEADLLKKTAIDSLHDIETLKMMTETFPQDSIIGKKLARELSINGSIPEDKQLLENLIERFKFKRSDFIEEAPKTFYKEIYSVSVLFPFVLNTIDPTPTRKRNQPILDLYEGIRMAADTLNKMGVKISLRVYDTERSVEKLKKILARDEVRSSDLIIGPIFQEQNALVQEFSLKNKINTFNPISNNSDYVRDNPYGFLFQPSLETIGAKSAAFLATHTINKKCIVFYGESKRDSILAASFLAEADSSLKVLRVERITKGDFRKILDILQTPTEFDEFKYPSQFTLPKDSVDCIYVASDDPLIYAKVIGSVETRGDKILILGSENWLDQTSIDYNKYQTLGIVLAAPTFSYINSKSYRLFQQKFIKTHGRVPSSSPYSNYAKLGYEFMLFTGQALKKYGVYFQEGLSKEKFIKGYLLEGYNFQSGKDNTHVPFIKFENGELVAIDK